MIDTDRLLARMLGSFSPVRSPTPVAKRAKLFEENFVTAFCERKKIGRAIIRSSFDWGTVKNGEKNKGKGREGVVMFECSVMKRIGVAEPKGADETAINEKAMRGSPDHEAIVQPHLAGTQNIIRLEFFTHRGFPSGESGPLTSIPHFIVCWECNFLCFAGDFANDSPNVV
ncbi:hypothetical protein CEXT_285491 [Caerostris extrusa]|uniref:Uncharacterized protein n=1 Tax=Caerostris extrusa TaxID=172846 RepID=A0AAV4T1A4_CAEEX|nr:hypothetical protein CEXT_285491 [Caerostris extrusa]